MKKIMAGVMITAVVLFMGTLAVSAAEEPKESWQAELGQGTGFVDEDGDGLCDYASQPCRFAGEYHDGICRQGTCTQGCGSRNQGTWGHCHRRGGYQNP